MSPRRLASRAAAALRRADWPSLAGGCLLWAAWSESAVGAGLPTRSGVGSAALLAATVLALARAAALRDGASLRRRGGVLASLASVAAGALASLAAGATLPGREVASGWDLSLIHI